MNSNAYVLLLQPHSSCSGFILWLIDMQSCSVGAKVWGVVSDVMHHGLTISLPDGLKGYVIAHEVQTTAWIHAIACTLQYPQH